MKGGIPAQAFFASHLPLGLFGSTLRLALRLIRLPLDFVLEFLSLAAGVAGELFALSFGFAGFDAGHFASFGCCSFCNTNVFLSIYLFGSSS
jgi:hypothetical protein